MLPHLSAKFIPSSLAPSARTQVIPARVSPKHTASSLRGGTPDQDLDSWWDFISWVSLTMTSFKNLGMMFVFLDNWMILPTVLWSTHQICCLVRYSATCTMIINVHITFMFYYFCLRILLCMSSYWYPMLFLVISKICSNSSFETSINILASSERIMAGWQGVHFLIVVQLNLGIRHMGSTYLVQLTYPKLCLGKKKALDSILLPYQHSQSWVFWLYGVIVPGDYS